MGEGRAERIEAIIDRLAAAVFSGAAAFCTFKLGAFGGPQAWLLPLAAAASGYIVCALLLRSVQPQEPAFGVAHFDVAELGPAGPEELLLDDPVELLLTEPLELLLTEPVELVLTEADRVQPAQTRGSEELMLDDILAELGPNSRVVRLFDPAAMPTPAQLNARIERHLGEEAPPIAPDASQALYDALAELRRSLR